jgi:phosphoribosylformylglycinamidine cyclo-ligase
MPDSAKIGDRPMGDAGTTPGEPRALTYAEAGVDIEAGEAAVALMRPAVAGASRLANRFGSFGAAVASPGSDMLLVSSADGVGTKLCLARTDAECAGMGRDLVHHCIDDILTSGARPMFFLDYLAFARLNPTRAAAIVQGMATACESFGCALIGGETAELPDLYQADAFDIAGFIVGSVERTRLLTGAEIQPGDTLIGLPSAGLHTNGYTLARKLLSDRLDERLPITIGSMAEDNRVGSEPDVAVTIRDALLSEHRCYLPEVSPLLERRLIRGIAHITGGGLPGNVPRMLPDGMSARLDPQTWPMPPIFAVLAAFNLPRAEMYRTFNMGIGMVLACAPSHAHEILASTSNTVIIGDVVPDNDSGRVNGLW